MPFDNSLVDLEPMPVDLTNIPVRKTNPSVSKTDDRVAVGNSLAAIGIHPVPRDIAEAHKAKIVERYRLTSPLAERLVSSGLAHWSRRQINRYDGFTHATPRKAGFRSVYQALSRAAGNSTPDRSAAPPAIIAVAETVYRQLGDTAFEIEYFYDDPILNVYYKDTDGITHRDCLGIWDNGKVVAIASLPVKPTWIKRWFGRLSHR